jgi:hypothetical protein
MPTNKTAYSLEHEFAKNPKQAPNFPKIRITPFAHGCQHNVN